MKKSSKVFMLIIMILGVSLFAVGCDKFNFKIFNASEENIETEVTIAPSDKQNNTDIDVDNTALVESTVKSNNSESEQTTVENTTPTPSTIQPTANVDLPIYTINANGDIELVTASINEETVITPQLIVDTVVDSMADQSIVIGIKQPVTTKDDAIIVDFDKEKTPYKEVGDGYEAAILNAIAQSLIDNLEDYNKVIYRVDGGPYKSGAFELEIDEAYFER